MAIKVRWVVQALLFFLALKKDISLFTIILDSASLNIDLYKRRQVTQT